MLAITLTKDDQSVSLKSDGESIEDAIALAQKVIGWQFEQTVELQIVEEEDDAIYCEGVEPVDHVLHDGM